MTDIAPGWYRDPVDPLIQRYWDGEAYLGEPIPADVTPPDGPPAATPVLFDATPATNPATAAGVSPRSVTPTPAPAGTGQTEPGWPSPEHPAAQPGSPTQAGFPNQPGSPAQPGFPNQPGFPAPGQPGIPVQQVPPQGWPAYPRLVLPPPRPHGFPLAGIGARFVARMVDTLAVLGLNVLVNGWFVYQFLKTLKPFAEATSLQGGSTKGLEPPPEASNLMVIIVVLAAALWFAYEVPQIANTGQTLGKRLLGIRVMQVDGDGPVGFRRAIRRWNTLGLPTLLWPCYGLGFVLQGLDCLWLLLDRPLHQALHDKSALTVVVTVGTGGSEGTRP